MSLRCLSSRCGCGGLVEGAVAEHGVQDVAASSGEADEGGVVAFALGAFAVVVGAADGVVEGGQRGQEQRSFEFAVAGPGGCSPRFEVPDRRVTGARPA